MRYAVCALTCFLFPISVWAGGPATVFPKEMVFKWDSAKPVNFSIDNGSLGNLPRDEAARIVEAAFQKWERVSTSSLRFNSLGFLTQDVTSENFDQFFSEPRPENPIVFDSDGRIIEKILGAGASHVVLGFAGIRYVDSEHRHYLSGRAVLNGLRLTAGDLEQVVLHEVGHLVGLDHTQAGQVFAENLIVTDNPFVPVMYPFMVSNGAREPRPDDISWISWLYAEANFQGSTGRIAGRVLAPEGEPLVGVNVVAVPLERKADGSLSEILEKSVSVVSDFLMTGDGRYELPGLAPGEYIVFIEPLDSRFSGASSVGPYLERLTDFRKDYFNGVNESGNGLDDPEEKTTIQVVAGQTIVNIDVVVNESIDASSTSSDVLIFPLSVNLGHPLFRNTFIGVSLHNPNGRANTVSITAVEAERPDQKSIRFATSLAPGAQEAFLTSRFSVPSAPGAHLIARGEDGPIQGLFLVGDGSLTRLDGVGAKLKAATKLYFSAVHQGSQAATVLFLSNASESREAQVQLNLFSRDGVLLKTASLKIAKLGAFANTLDQIFGSVENAGEGYLQLASNIPIKGFSLCARETDFTLLPAEVPVQTRELLASHFLLAQGGNTEIRLLNAGSETVFAKVKAFDSRSALLGTAEMQLAPRQLFIGKLDELLKLKISAPLTGHVVVELTEGKAGVFPKAATVTGTLTLIGNNGRFRTLLPLVSEGQKEMIFLRASHSKNQGLFTGLAIFNPTNQAAAVTVSAFSPDGRLKSRASLNLPAGGRVADLLDGAGLFGEGFQWEGYLRLSSTTPIVASAFIGDFNSEFVATIESQEP